MSSREWESAGPLDDTVDLSNLMDEAVEQMPLREEDLRVRTERVESGQVQVRKEIVAEQRTIEVPVVREEVLVKRVPADRRPAAAPIGEPEGFEIPVYEEEVHVEKRPVVYEEVSVGMEAIADTEVISETVRREVPVVEADGDVRVDRGMDAALAAGHTHHFESGRCVSCGSL